MMNMKNGEQVYKNFANVAREEGFLAVSNSFDKIAQIEKIHGDRFGEFCSKDRKWNFI